MQKAKWIWCFGEFEIYHHMLLGLRRRESGCDYPSMWYLSRPELAAKFFTEFTAQTDFTLRVCSTGGGRVLLNGKPYPINSDIAVSSGEYRITVEAFCVEAFPAIFADSEYLKTNESWRAELYGGISRSVSADPEFLSEQTPPTVFPFRYTDLTPIKTEKTDSGILCDFGRESFGIITLGKTENCGKIKLTFGESRAEALDFENAVIRDELFGEYSHERPACAFRYIHLQTETGVIPDFTAKEQIAYAERKGSFVCDRSLVNDIWLLSARTLELTHRECYIDGIKRDRWVWSGDAYQSFQIDRYIYFDSSIAKRTVISLLGKPPFRTHINTINDYSSYMFISVWEYYFATADTEFVRNIYPVLEELFAFIVSRLDENGYIVHRKRDWIFIDWGVLDKTDPVCAEQIIFYRAALAMSSLCSIVGGEDIYSPIAKRLKSQIIRDYWDGEKGGFVDSYTSGKRFTSRQTNVLAVLFGIADDEKKRKIVKNILLSDSLPEITTPYFKFFELCALAESGEIEIVQDYIEDYWGAMLRRNATCVWEQYIPGESDEEATSMYGNKFGRSLCHAWGAGPILLLGKYVAGVRPTSPGYKTYEVKPNPGRYREFECNVPVPDKTIRVVYKNGSLFIEEIHK